MKIWSILVNGGIGELHKRWRDRNLRQSIDREVNKKYKTWFEQNYPKKTEKTKFSLNPKISVITPVFDPNLTHFEECIMSVVNQSYKNWELCLADDHSTNNAIRDLIVKISKKDRRIKYFFRKTNGHISRASNDALKMATGDYVAILDHDDFLWPNALSGTVRSINENPKAELIYSDEDKLDNASNHFDPFFKPGWNLDYLIKTNYINHLAVIKRSVLSKVGEFRVGFEGSQDWDLFLRVSEKVSKKNIVHIPTILYSWRVSPQSTASRRHIETAKKYVWSIQEKVLAEYLKRNRIQGKPVHSQYLGFWSIEKNGKKVSPDSVRKSYYKILKRETLRKLEIPNLVVAQHIEHVSVKKE